MILLKKIFLALLLTSSSLIAQNPFDEVKTHLEECAQVEDIFQIQKINFDTFKIMGPALEFKRELDFGYIQHKFLIYPNPGWILKINSISKDDKIVMILITEFNDSKDKNIQTDLINKDLSFINKYLNQHNQFYDTNLTELNFRKQFTTDYVVGFNCGYSGSDSSKESRNIMKWSNRDKLEKLDLYLTSISPELQVLGAIGLLKNGTINLKQERIIEHLKKRNTLIYGCNGCNYGASYNFNEWISDFE